MLTADGESERRYIALRTKKIRRRSFLTSASICVRNLRHFGNNKKKAVNIYYPDTFSFIKALAADTKTMDGLNAHFFSQDEFHEARTSKQNDVMKQSQSAREQPLAC
jgi:phage terminase large subunit-like protein